MEGYVSEREQVDAIKKWWDDNGKAILVGLIVGLGGLAGYRYWDSSQTVQAENASINYEQFLNLASQGASKEAHEAGQAILDAYPNSTYSRLTGLLLAKIDVQEGKLEDAQKSLQWVIDHASGEEIAAIAQARLAQIILAEGNADAAWSTVSQIDEAHADQFAELKGDILAAQGKKTEAGAMYTKAEDFVVANGGDPALLALKMEHLGLAKAAE